MVNRPLINVMYQNNCFCCTARESARCTHVSPPTPPRSSQSTELSSLRSTAGTPELPALHLLVNTCPPQSPSSFHSSSPPRVPWSISTSVSPLLPHEWVHLCHFSRSHMYALIHSICFSLTYFTLYD